MSDTCKTCGQELPLIVDIAQALQDGLDKDGVPGVNEHLIREAIRELRALRRSETKLSDQVIYLIREAIRELRTLRRSETKLSDQVISLREDLAAARRNYAIPWRPSMSVIDVSNPRLHMVKQIVAVEPLGPMNEWRVEIR